MFAANPVIPAGISKKPRRKKLYLHGPPMGPPRE